MVLFIASVIILSCTTSAQAGAWTQPPGAYYAKIAFNRLATTSDFDINSDKQSKLANGKLTDLTLSAYLEYGLRERLTLVASAPFKRLEDERTFTRGIGIERDTHFGDLELRLRCQLLDSPVVTALAAGAKFPLGYKVREQSNVPLGTGEWDQEIRLLLGRSLYPFPGYATGDVGWRHRGGNFSNEMFFSAEMGASWNKVLFKGTISSVRTLGECAALTQGGLVGDQDILKLAPGIIYSLTERLEISLDLFHIAAGCNTTAGSTWSVGAALKP